MNEAVFTEKGEYLAYVRWPMSLEAKRTVRHNKYIVKRGPFRLGL